MIDGPRLLLFLCALIYLALGIGFLIKPDGMASGIEIPLPTPTARADLMATYGGLEIGLAVFLFLCWRDPAWLRMGLVASGLTFAGLGGARLVGILVARGAVKPLLFWLLAAEAVLVALCFWASRKA